jgi:tetratricopeptide (TPR) repeat protein
VLAGSVYFLRDKATNALDYLLRALKLETGCNGAESMKLIECYYWLGEASIKLSKYTQSKDFFSKAYRLYNRHKVS